MKKIYEIFDLLTDILDCVRSINRTIFIDRVCNPTEKQIASFLASNPLELQRVFREIAENPVPPVAFG